MRKKKPWARYFMDMARGASAQSLDPSSQVGCTLAIGHHDISSGYNDLPSGLEHTEERYERPLKYRLIVHAEQNAIATAAKLGRPTKGATAYVTLRPCSACAILLINAGITCIVVPESAYEYKGKYEEDMDFAEGILKEAGIDFFVLRENEDYTKDILVRRF